MLLLRVRNWWVVYGYSPRDGGWARLHIGGRTEEEAWRAVLMFWDFMVLAGDYESITVKHTIRFR